MSNITIETVHTSNAPAPIGPYSQAKRIGSLVFTAGQIGMDKNGIVEGNVEDQTRRALENLRFVLEAAGSNLSSVIKTTIFLADMDDFLVVNGVYSEYFSETAPARSTVEVSRLPKDARVEIEAIALVVQQ